MASLKFAPHKRILLIDDCYSTRELLSMILGCQGYIVSTATNGAEAIEKLRSMERPDLILLDLLMPVMDGWAFSEELGRDAGWATIPILILSAARGEREPTPGLKDVTFLDKPVETAELLRAVYGTCCATSH